MSSTPLSADTATGASGVRDDLIRHGADVSEVFHNETGRGGV